MSLKLDPSDLIDALNFVERVTGRDVVESLNRAGLHTIIGSRSYPGAMQLTPKASVEKINAVSDRQLAGFVIKRAKRKGKWPMTKEQVNTEVKRERKRRRSAVGYAAYAGWNNAAKGMGGKGIKRGVHAGFHRSEARFGYGTAAKVGQLEAEIVNTAPAAERIGGEALQQGMNNAAKDLVDYGTRKLQKTFDKVKP